MAAIRNVGEAVIEQIVQERTSAGPFKDVYDFLRRVDASVLNRRTMESLIKAGAFDSLGVPRLGFSLKVDELVEVTLNRRKDMALGISTLFAAMGEATADDWEGTAAPIPAAEYEQSVKLDFEREMLGTYVSDHPLYAVEKLLATRADGTITYLKENAEADQRIANPFTVGGILSEVTLRTTKEGKPYARTVLEDLGGALELNISSAGFGRVSGSLAKDNIVLARVRFDIRDDEVRFTAVDIEVLKTDSGPQELRLALRPEELTSTTIARLREILTQHPGPSPVVLETGEAGQAFRLGDSFNVSITSVVPDLRSEFGRHVILA